MDWMEKYSWGEVVEEAPLDQGFESVVFDGEGVNELIAQKLVAPLNMYDSLVYEFLETVPSNNVSKLLVNLASDGMLQMFKAAVESYIKEGHATDVAGGTEDGISSLQEWFDNFRASGGDRPPFDTLENEIRRFVSV